LAIGEKVLLILYYFEEFAGVRVLLGNGFQGVRLS
jgi:hypothetical protein